jgi:large subunit ribosomal protein L29
MADNIMKTSALRKLSDDELQKYLEDFKKELFNLRFQHHTGRLENSSRIRHVKHNVARILTLQTERKQEATDILSEDNS